MADPVSPDAGVLPASDAPPMFNNDPLPQLTPADARDLGESLVKQGMSRERVNAALAEHGVALDEPCDRSPAERAYDFAFPQPRDGDYNIQMRQHLEPDAGLNVVADFTTEANDFVRRAGFPEGTGNSFVDIAMADASSNLGMNDEQKAEWQRAQFALMTKVLGEDRARAYVKTYDQLLRQTGGRFAELIASGPASADQIIALVQQAERLAIKPK